MKKIISFVPTVCLITILYAQPKNNQISGIVKDSLRQPLMYVTVTVARQSQPLATIKSTYTNEKGLFSFFKMDTGRYVVNISHTGFIAREENIIISDGQSSVPLAVILLRKNRELKNLTLKARKPLIEQEADKVIFNVEADPIAKTETAMDILKKTPFVSVDGDDNVQVNGQSNFKVLVNGRESSMFARNIKEALKGFPGALITKIEVITSPSAKFDGEGVGGIINIITRKKTNGYNGSISTNYNSFGRLFYTVNISAKVGKWGITLSHSQNIGKKVYGSGISDLIPLSPSLFTRREEDGISWRRYSGNFQNMEISYGIDSLNSLAVYANMGYFKGGFASDDVVTTEYASAPTTYTDLVFGNDWNEPSRSIGLDYIRKFREKKDREFSLRFYKDYFKTSNHRTSETELTYDNRYALHRDKSPSDQYNIQSDYILPLKRGKLESGAKVIFRRADAYNESLIKYDAAAEYQKIPGNNDQFNYKQDVYSVYSSYTSKIKKIDYRVGLRIEYTRVDGNLVSSAKKVQQGYINFLPNLQATYKLTKTYTLVVSYNKRLSRPYIWNLNPFINYIDSMNISYGNPNLDAQIIHSIAWQNQFQKGNSFMGVTLTGSYSNNSIVSYSELDKTRGIVSNTSGNLGKDMQLTLNANLNTKFTPDWNLSLNGNLTYNHIENRFATEMVGEGVGGNGNLNTIYSFTKKLSISGNVGFWRGPVTFQTTRNANYWYSLGSTYKLFKEKLTISSAINNFLQKDFVFHTKTTDPYFIRTLTFTWPNRHIRIGLNYTFGKLREKVSKKKGVSNDDLMGKESN